MGKLKYYIIWKKTHWESMRNNMHDLHHRIMHVWFLYAILYQP